MTDWATISSLATAGGTLVLAAATFASVRSGNRSARIAELALQEQRRPVLVQSRLEDPVQEIMFADGYWLRASGSHAACEHVGEVVYMAISLRNVSAGIGVLQGWSARVGLLTSTVDHAPLDQLRSHTRDLYVPAGDIGLWQGALRKPSDSAYTEVAAAVDQRQTITIELFYTDQVGGQRTITRFSLTPAPNGDWLASVGRHWYLDQASPR